MTVLVNICGARRACARSLTLSAVVYIMYIGCGEIT